MSLNVSNLLLQLKNLLKDLHRTGKCANILNKISFNELCKLEEKVNFLQKCRSLRNWLYGGVSKIF